MDLNVNSTKEIMKIMYHFFQNVEDDDDDVASAAESILSIVCNTVFDKITSKS